MTDSAKNPAAAPALYYRSLFSRWGPQNWWPAQSRFEVIVGAYLTQNTAWINVEKAIAELRRHRMISIKAIREVSLGKLQRRIRSAGFFRQKAQSLKTFVRYLDERHGGSLDRMFAQPTDQLRIELLALKGIGPETADSILLYAGGKEIFVVDAYTRRIFERHGIIDAKVKYDRVRLLAEHALSQPALSQPRSQTPMPPRKKEPRHPPSRMSRAARSELSRHYNEFHALIVRVGNQYCRSNPQCEQCPLREFLPR